MNDESLQTSAPAQLAGYWLQQAVDLHRQGRTLEAGELYARVIEIDARQPDALHLLGVVRTQCGEATSGAALIERSLSLNPAQPIAWSNLGNAQLAASQTTRALASFDRSIRLHADYAPAHNGRGSALAALGRHAEALASFERALALLPDFREACANRATILMRMQRHAEAVHAYGILLESQPQDAAALTQRALARCALRQFDAALEDAECALRIHPGQARHARVVALLGLGRATEVISEFEAADDEALDPNLCVLWGNALSQVGRGDGAAAQYRRALELQPDLPEALLGMAIMASAARQFDRAAEWFERLEKAGADGDFHSGICLHARLQLFDWRDYSARVSSIMLALRAGRKSDLPFTFLSLSDDPNLQQQCARLYAATFPGPAGGAAPVTRAHAKIRIAFVSADFLEHPMAYLLAGLFEMHDRSRFEMVAISLRADGLSPTARRLERAFDRFIDVSGRSDADIARTIAEAEADIAVDLMGYTSEQRPGVLLGRPAPIQVNYLGFPATMGSDHIDYLIADEFVIPPAMAACYDENIVYLPNCFQGNDARRLQPAGAMTRAAAGLPAAGFVWGAFNGSVKLNPPMFDIWARLLETVPGSVLWLAAHNPTAERNLQREALARGVDPARLVFARREAYPTHLARLGLADVCLDTWPFNGGATTSDALWSGVPVVTLTGRAFCSRMSGSLLRTLGLDELVTESFGAYERTARRLAEDPTLLESLRARLRRARTGNALFDTRTFTTHIESAYVTMHERRQRGEMPASFVVGPGDAVR